MTTGKTIALTRRTFVGKVMSLLFNVLSRLVITFLPRSKRLLISWLQSPSAVILEPKKIKSDTKSFQLCPTLCNPLDYSLPGSSVHRDSPVKNTGVGGCALPLGVLPMQSLMFSALAGRSCTTRATWEAHRTTDI